ncbi:MAG: hypothetical protein IPN76_04135 [Saprospiraceae bacterium]|nr:hypothetical protein [Saprospiraceae bacterium]
MRPNVHAQLNTELSKKVTLTPELYYSNMGLNNQVQAHAWPRLLAQAGEQYQGLGGLGYRVGDSCPTAARPDYKDIKVQRVTISRCRNCPT